MTCRICSGDLKLYLNKNGYDILKCSRCGFGQVDLAAEDIADFYNEAYFAGDTASFSQAEDCDITRSYRYWIEAHLNRLPKGPGLRVLEIGPGLGAPIAGYITQVYPEIEFAAVEISPYARERLSARGFNVFPGRVTDSETQAACRGKYDLIFGTEVIEHDPEPRGFVRAVHEMLKPGGRAAFTTGNIDGGMARWNKERWYYLDPPAHVSYYTPKAIRHVFGTEGFQPVSIRRYGFKYINWKMKTRLPGILALTHLTNISTGMSVVAQRSRSSAESE
jgi:SAM-dependent methyltransferase